MKDPYTLVYDKLIDIMLSSAALQTAVPRLQHNLVNYNNLKKPRKNELREGDLPEIQLVSASVNDSNLNIASNAVQIKRAYRILVSAGTGKLEDTIYKVEWALTCALCGANFHQELFDLQWFGDNFVRGVTLSQTTQGESDPAVNRMVQGWASVWEIQVHFLFQQTRMINFNKGIPLETV